MESTLAESYKAISDESRMRLISILSHGYFNVQEITAILDLSQPTISHHLRTLQKSGFAKSRKEGTWVYYTLSSENPVQAQIAKDLITIVGSSTLNGAGEIFRQDQQKVSAILHKRRDDVKRFFDAVAPEWNKLGHDLGLNIQYLTEVASRISPSESVLELGCGSGSLLQKIAPRKGTTIGVDQSQPMLDEAKKNLGELSKGIDLRLGYLEHLPVADASIDCAVASMVFHHLASPIEAIRDVYRILRAGGRLIICDLTRHSNELMRERHGDLWLGFEIEELSSWLQAAGFCRPSHEPIGPNGEIFILTAIKEKE